MKTFVTLAIIVVACVFLVGGCMATYGKSHDVTFTVTDKERDSSSGKYLIFTENETFRISNSLIKLRFSGSDLYGKIKRDHTYNGQVYGWRIPLFSAYRNLVSATPVNAQSHDN